MLLCWNPLSTLPKFWSLWMLIFFFLTLIWQNYLTWNDMRLFIVFIIPLSWIFMFSAEILMQLITSYCPDHTRDIILCIYFVIVTKSRKFWYLRPISHQSFVFFEVCVCVFTHMHTLYIEISGMIPWKLSATITSKRRDWMGETVRDEFMLPYFFLFLFFSIPNYYYKMIAFFNERNEENWLEVLLHVGK